MNKMLSVAVAITLANGAVLAQTTAGDADPAQSMGSSKAHAATKAERAEARQDRLAETARESKAGELSPGGEASGAAADDHGKRQAYTKEQRTEARKERLEESAKENRAGEITSGEK